MVCGKDSRVNESVELNGGSWLRDLASDSTRNLGAFLLQQMTKLSP